jgi:hypothetical protein
MKMKIETQQKEADNVIYMSDIKNEKETPKLVTAGSVPPGTNWLNALQINCIFLATEQNSTSIDVMEYTLLRKKGKACWLSLRAQDKEILLWVNSQRFSNRMVLFEILDEGVPIDE